jgi:hypothetical protein
VHRTLAAEPLGKLLIARRGRGFEDKIRIDLRDAGLRG